MKKIFLTIFFIIISSISVPAQENEENSSCFLLQIKKNEAPLRLDKNENAKRFVHLKKGVVLYGCELSGGYWKVNLNGKTLWVNKNNVHVLKNIENKPIQEINKIKISENKNFYLIEIKETMQTAWSFQEFEKSLIFELYDTFFDPANVKNSKKNSLFDFKRGECGNLTLLYSSDAPLFGYETEVKKNKIIVKIRKPPIVSAQKPLKNIRIMLDAGHGGKESGVCVFGVREKDVNLQIVKKLAKELKKEGARVYLTRKFDKKVPLYERVNKAKVKNAQILLSIHQNSLPDRSKVDKKHGVGVYYYNREALPLAESIQRELVNVTNFRNDGVNYASFVLTRPTEPVSVLIECGYLIRKEEMEKLTNTYFQALVAKAISKGLKTFLTIRFQPLKT